MEKPTQGRTREDTYDRVTIIFHWLVVGMTANQFLLALFPGVMKGSLMTHQTVGLSLIVVVVARLIWRMTAGRSPVGVNDASLVTRIAAKLTQFAMYALLIVIPVLGWAYSDAMVNPVPFFGISLPMLSYHDRALAAELYWWKTVLSYSLLTLIFAHAAAAILYHRLVRRDGVLQSMLPQRPVVAEEGWSSAMGDRLASVSNAASTNR